MSGKISANRFRLTVLMAFLVALALGSSWALLVMNKKLSIEAKPAERTEPDYIVQNFSYVRMTPQGQARYHLTGDTLIHRPADDSFVVEKPVLVSFGKRGEKQTIVSDLAVAEDENRKVHLYGNVVVDRPPFGNIEAFHMTTDYLLLFPDEDIMQTPKDVVITRGNNNIKLTGTGMYANNVTRELRLHDQTRVFFAATEKPGQ